MLVIVSKGKLAIEVKAVRALRETDSFPSAFFFGERSESNNALVQLWKLFL
jgi:hypothetical protein